MVPLAFAQPYIWKKGKTYNSGCSLVVIHLTTNPLIHSLNIREQIRSVVFHDLRPYVVADVHFFV